MMKYLTREKKANPKLPDVFPASEAPIPKVREDVETIEAINRFVRDNPVEKAEGGRIGFKKGERADLQFENLTRRENAKIQDVSVSNARGFKSLPDYPNITYTDYLDKKTGKKFRTYGVPP